MLKNINKQGKSLIVKSSV